MKPRKSIRVGAALIVVLATFAAAGCGDDTEQEQPLDAGADALVDGGDAGTDSGADAGPQRCLTGEPTAVEASAPEELEVPTWLIGQADGSIQSALELGDFEMPTPGADKYGATWLAVGPEDDGTLSRRGMSGTLWAVATVQVDQPEVVIAKADNVYRFYANGVPQPGDVYGHGDKRVPIILQEGTNQLAIQISNRAAAKVELFETPDMLAFNTADMTSPDLRVGSDEALPLGVAVLNLSGHAAFDVEATVLENDYFKESTLTYPALGPNAVTQVGFQLEPKAAFDTADETIPVRLRLASCSLEQAYEVDVELSTVAPDANFKRTLISPVDASVQYYGVVPPANFEPGRQYGMVLSLHGAGVEGIGQANAYSPKDWTYIIAPTNRRRFGFDWEEWGHLNGLSALDDAMERFAVDPTKVYVTGHSMGGHGTWHFGAMNPGRFATIGPSAGWGSFYSYTGASRPSGTIARARAHSDTHHYLSNLARRGVYIIHGSDDNNVPVSEGRAMRDAVSQYTDDVQYHEEPGAGHWWNGDVADGADCVDWPDLFSFMNEHTLDPNELDFEFTTPGPRYSAEHSYVTIQSIDTPMEDAVLTSEKTGQAEVTLTTTNVRAMDLDAAALAAKGITDIVVDGDSYEVSGESIEIGPHEGKVLGVGGPFNQVFQRPFCFVYPNEDNGFQPEYRDYAAYLLSTWSLIGNGHGCAVPLSQVTEELRDERNLIYLGISWPQLPGGDERPFDLNRRTVGVGNHVYANAAMLTVFPEGERLSAAMYATAGATYLLFRYQPFSSRAGMPDYLIWGDQGANAVGFYTPQWTYDESLGQAQ